MLQELAIENFAIISTLRLNFHHGMNALTGETGAGKSIIIDAMSLLAGGRTSHEYIREGAEKCLLEGIFDLPEEPELLLLLKELGIETEEATLIVQRDISRSGKNTCRINGRTITLANLRRVGEFLVDIQGQNEHQELMHQERHLVLLDSYGSKQFQEKKQQYGEVYQVYRDLAEKVQRLQDNSQAFIQRIDMLTFQQEEIADAQLVAGEEEQLQEEWEKLTNFQKIKDTLGNSFMTLSGEEFNSVDQIGNVVSEMETVAGLDQEYQQVFDNLQSAYYLLQDAASELSRQVDMLEMDEARLEEVSQRLEVIRQLKRKYGDSVADILSYYQEISKELAESDFSEGQLVKLEEALGQQETRVVDLATQLHGERQKIASKLAQAILKELKELYMEHTEFEVRFLQSSPEKLTKDGFDQVAFYITTNPGEPLKPLVKVASGGELSRVMLALKTIFSKAQGMTSIVFDEVDTGVSGRVAEAIADKIYQIGVDSQVLCITHLPQVAARANHQYHIVKEVVAGRTETKVTELTVEERIPEVARMLAGSEITPLALQHAKELLRLVNKK